MIRSSDFEIPEVDEQVRDESFPMRVEKVLPSQAYEVVPPVGQVNGARLMDACGYDRRLAAVLICTRKNWKELLDTMSPALRGGVEAMVVMLRQGLGLPVD